MDISTALSHRGYRFPAGIIAPRVWLYFRFCLSFRDVQEMMLECGAEVSHEGIYLWTFKFGAEYTYRLQRDVDHFPDARHTEGSVRPLCDIQYAKLSARELPFNAPEKRRASQRERNVGAGERTNPALIASWRCRLKGGISAASTRQIPGV